MKCCPDNTLFTGCFCAYKKVEQEGYDAYVSAMAVKNSMPSCRDGINACPYNLGSDDRKTWMTGWNRARGDV